jgi:hypothetical protein
MQLELMWHCGSHQGCELFRDDLLAHSAAEFFRHVPEMPLDRLTPAARTVLRRTAASRTETEIMVRRYALAWLALSDLRDSRGPVITIAIRRSDRNAC